MRLIIALLVLTTAFSYSLPVQAAVVHPAPQQETTLEGKSTNKKLERKAKRQQRKELRRMLKDQIRAAKASGAASDAEFVLLIVLAILLPPVAFFIHDGGASTRFFLSLGIFLGGALLAILGLGALAGIAALANVIYALYVVLTEA